MSNKKPNYVWTTPSVFHMVVGADATLSNELEGTGTLTAPDSKIFRGGVDVSAAELGGTAAVSNRIMTAETFTPTKKGTYILIWNVTDEGETRYLKTKILVSNPGDG